jgi:hypothetical protein
MVIVSEKSIEKMIYDVAPKIEELSGWKPQLDGLNVKLIPRELFWEEAIKPKYASLGINTDPRTKEGEISLKMLKHMMPLLVLGVYEPSNRTLFVLPDNMSFGTNESGVVLTVGHELFHGCQFDNNPYFKEELDRLTVQVTGRDAFDKDDYETTDKRVMKKLTAMMTIVEGDATFVQNQLKGMYYQDAVTRAGDLGNILTYLHAFKMMNLSKEDIEELKGSNEGEKKEKNENEGLMGKMMQYTKGEKLVKATYNRLGRSGVNELYTPMSVQMMDMFTRSD